MLQEIDLFPKRVLSIQLGAPFKMHYIWAAERDPRGTGSFPLLTGNGKMSGESSCNFVKTTIVLIYIARTAQ
jgi:hypothetical protein